MLSVLDLLSLMPTQAGYSATALTDTARAELALAKISAYIAEAKTEILEAGMSAITANRSKPELTLRSRPGGGRPAGLSIDPSADPCSPVCLVIAYRRNQPAVAPDASRSLRKRHARGVRRRSGRVWTERVS
jgi:hypothetical protein